MFSICYIKRNSHTQEEYIIYEDYLFTGRVYSSVYPLNPDLEWKGFTARGR